MDDKNYFYCRSNPFENDHNVYYRVKDESDLRRFRYLKYLSNVFKLKARSTRRNTQGIGRFSKSFDKAY